MLAQSPTTELGVRQHYPDWQLPVDTARPGPNTALPQKTEASLTRGNMVVPLLCLVPGTPELSQQIEQQLANGSFI